MKIRRIILFLRVKGLNLAMHNTNKYILILIYISTNKNNDIKILYRIFKEIYLISDLKAYLFIDNNIIDLKKIIFNIARAKIYINSYDAITTIISR